MLTQARFHRRSYPQGLMHTRKVVMHVKQRDHRDVIIELLAEGIRQAGEAPHIHPHVEILALHIAGADMRWIGVTNEIDPLGAQTLRRAVAFLSLGIVAVDLYKHRVVDVSAERIRDGSEIHLMAVRGQLDAIPEPAGNILKEFQRTPGIPPSDEPSNHQLGIGINRRERPNVSAHALFNLLLGDVLFFAADETPDLIHLHALGGDIANHTVLVFDAGLANAGQQAKNSPFRHAGHADGDPDRASLNKRRNHRYLLRRADYICHDLTIRQRFRIRKRKVAEGSFLGAFLGFSPLCFSGLSTLRFRCSLVMVSRWRLPPILPPLAPISRMTC